MSTLQYAVHAYAWTPSWSNKCLDLIDRAKGLGFDVIEIPFPERGAPQLVKGGARSEPGDAV